MRLILFNGEFLATCKIFNVVTVDINNLDLSAKVLYLQLLMRNIWKFLFGTEIFEIRFCFYAKSKCDFILYRQTAFDIRTKFRLADD